MSANKQKMTGFTIVELLIVIVVIAILAAITLVAYNGVTAKAAKAVDVSTIQAYQNGIARLSVTGDLASTTSACLGPASSYSIADTPTSPQNCPEGGQTASQAASTTLNNQLHAIGIHDAVLAENQGVTPMYIWNYYNDGVGQILYAMPLNQDCGLPNVLSSTDYINNPFSSPWGLHGNPYSFRTSTITFCAVMVPLSN